jgi:hypothetical protein
MPRRPRRPLTRLAAAGVALALSTAIAAAHGGGGLGDAKATTLQVPFWLFLLTGGGVVGASFLLASFVTDRAFVRAVHDWRRALPAPPSVAGAARLVGPLLGALGVGYAVVVGLLGPPEALANAAVLLVWVGWWTGGPVVAYLVGNPWPLVNPWRAVAERVAPDGRLRYPGRLGAWPAVAGVLGLVWLEVLGPAGSDPRALAAAVAGYALVTLAGGLAFGRIWFRRADAVAKLFRYYGRVAPIQWRDGSPSVSVHGARLPEPEVVDGLDEVAFVVALLWVTTFDGFLSTPTWVAVAEAALGAGVPPAAFYLATLLGGFLVFFGGYLLAVGYARQLGETTTPGPALARRFAPSLLPIAAGYHLAHYLGYLLALLPVMATVFGRPFSPPGPVWLVPATLPGWFSGVQIAAVLGGHLLAVWVAHATAFDVFPSRLQAIRSQYALVAVMVVYTMVGLWIVSQPSLQPPT